MVGVNGINSKTLYLKQSVYSNLVEQAKARPRFLFTVKASRYLTPMKKLLNAEGSIA